MMQLFKYQRMVDRLPVTVKSLLLTATLGAVFITWYYSLWQNLQLSLDQANQNIVELNQTIPKLETQIKVKEQEINSKQKELLKEKHQRIYPSNHVLSPHKTEKLLTDLLTMNNSLTYLELKNLPPQEVILKQPGLKLFTHGIMIKFLGNYFSTVAYLKTLEKSTWQIFWDKLEYKVVQYPVAEVTLFIHTLSDSEDWLHV